MSNTPAPPPQKQAHTQGGCNPSAQRQGTCTQGGSKPAVSKVATPRRQPPRNLLPRPPPPSAPPPKPSWQSPAAAKPVGRKAHQSSQVEQPAGARQFHHPCDEYAGIDMLKERRWRWAGPPKERVAARWSDGAAGHVPNALHAALEAVPTIKTGRPKSGQVIHPPGVGNSEKLGDCTLSSTVSVCPTPTLAQPPDRAPCAPRTPTDMPSTRATTWPQRRLVPTTRMALALGPLTRSSNLRSAIGQQFSAQFVFAAQGLGQSVRYDARAAEHAQAFGQLTVQPGCHAHRPVFRP